MPKRSEKRDTAKAAYIARKAAGEEVSLRELAQEQGVSYQTLRNWKAADRWDEALPIAAILTLRRRILPFLCWIE